MKFLIKNNNFFRRCLVILIKPSIGLIFSVPLILYFSYIDLLWISPWNYILFFLVFIALLALFRRGKIKLNQFSQKILFIFILYIFLSTVINWVQGVPSKNFLYNDVVLISTLLLGFCTMFFIKNEKQLKTFVYFLIGFMSISAFVGILQFVGIDFFWKLREFWGVDPKIATDILARTRIPGLAPYSIPFGYQLAAIVPLIFGILTVSGKKVNKYYLSITFIICFLALLVTKSRSAIIGGILALVIITFWGKLFRIEKKKLFALGAVLIVTISIFVYLPTLFSTYRFRFQDIGTLTRIPALIISGKVFLNHPFGTGKDFGKYYDQYSSKFEELTYKYAHKYAPHRLQDLSYFFKTNRMISPHNHFINILLYYGIFGLLLLILFYYYIFRGLFHLFRNNKDRPLIKAIVLGLIGSFIAYITNSLFHNCGPFLIDPFHWYFIGMTLFLLNHYGKSPKLLPKYKIAQN